MVVQVHSHHVAPTSNPNSSSTPSSAPAASPAPTLASSLPVIKLKRRSIQAIHRQRLREKRNALDAKLAAAKKKFVDEVVELGKEHHKSPREIQSRALIKSKFGIQKRKVNSYNAFRHMQSKQRKEAGQRQPFDEAQKEDQVLYQDACTENPEMIEEARKDLEAEKEAKRGHVQKNLRARAQHSEKVIKEVYQAVKQLEFSSEIEAFCIFVNGSNRDHPVLQAAYTDKGHDFVSGHLKLNVPNLLHDFQTFAQAGSKGLAKNHKDLQVQLRADVSALLLRSLQTAVDDPTERIKQMKYKNFNVDVCQKYQVKLVGWPVEELGEIRNPSLIGNKVLKQLVALLKSGVCHFEKLSPEEDN
ncbi:hypothetical protein FRC09_004175 [Ceratobasidium sp. 395]|nr:hypothetical protein FRC09_004175 [Ceratobasidium sp. 395]